MVLTQPLLRLYIHNVYTQHMYNITL